MIVQDNVDGIVICDYGKVQELFDTPATRR